MAGSIEVPSPLLAHLHEGVFVHDRNGRIVFANRIAEQMFNASPGGLTGKRTLEPVWPFVQEDGNPMDGADQPMATVLATGEPVHDLVVGIRGPDAGILWARLSAYPERAPDGSVDRVTVTLLDITGQVKRESRQRHVTGILRAIRKVNQLITHEKNARILVRDACALLAEERGYRSAWIALRDAAGRLHAAAEAGVGEAFEALRQRIERGEYPVCCRLAANTERVAVISDQPTRCGDCPLTIAYTNQAAMASALRHAGRDYGLLVVGLPRELAEEEEERSLFAEVADDLGFALHALEAEEERAKAENALKESQARLAFALEKSGTGGWDLDLATHTAFRTAEHARIFGYEPPYPDWSFQAFMSHIVAEDREWVGDLVKATIAEKTDMRFECRIRRADGEMRWIRVAGGVQVAPDGHAHRLGGIVMDVTQQKTSEEALRESRSKLEAALASMTDAVFISDTEGRFLDFNDAFATFHRFPNKQACAKTLAEYPAFLDVFLPSGRLAPLDQWAVPRALRGETATNAEYILRRRDTGDTWVGSYSFAPIRDASGLIVGSVVVGRDITQHKNEERALRESEERFRVLVDSAPDGIFVQSGERFQFLNPAALRILGAASQDELVGKDALMAVLPENREAVRRRMDEQRMTGKPVPPMEHEFLRPDGTRVPVETTAVAVRFQGRDSHLVFVRDATARRKAEAERQSLQAQLEQSQKMESVGRLAGGVAHDFNNILMVQRGYCRMMRSALKHDDPLAQGITQIDECAERATRLTRQLLAFSRKQALQPRVFDMNRLVGDLDSMLRRLIGEDVELLTVPSPEPAMVKADPGQIEQVIVNLVVNARDAMAEGGKLTIEVSRVEISAGRSEPQAEAVTGPAVMLAVSDTGTGMDQETMRHIFEPFFTTKGEGKGTGLGLSTVYGIVLQSGGSISVYSEKDRGTAFKIALPRVADEPEIAAAIPGRHEELPVARGRGQLVLLVEDEPPLRQIAQVMIDSLGYKTVTAANGGEALILVEEQGVKPDVLVTDVVMPGMNGRVLVDRLRKTQPSLRAIFMSGYTENAIVHHGVLDAGVRFLEKPFTMEQLAAELHSALENE